MPTLPWITPNPPSGHSEAVIMASRLEVTSLRHVPRFFFNSLAAWRQVSQAQGAFGASLIAEPFKGVFWTLSAWESKEAMYAYAKAEPHRQIMQGLRSVMKVSHFIFWTAAVEELPIAWADAKERLAQHRAEKPQGTHA
jgi:heme-degrading monooxygenase HmoA